MMTSEFTNSASSSVQEARAYTAAVLKLLGSRDPLDVLEHTSAALVDSVRGLSDQKLKEPEAPGKWSISHVLRHLADSEIVWAYRVRMVLAQDRPQLVGYDQDLWATRLGYELTDADQAIEEFSAVRLANLRLLRRLSPTDLRRVGVHAERGEETVEHMMRLYAGHDLVHLRQLDRIRRVLSDGVR